MPNKLHKLAEIFDFHNLGIIFKIFGCGRNISTDILNTENAYCNETRILLSVFVLQKSVTRENIEKIVGKNLLEYMLAIKLLKSSRNKISSKYILRYYNSNYFFYSDKFGIGYTEALDSFVAITPKNPNAKNALILFSFFGIEAIYGVSPLSNVDIHTYKASLDIVKINCELNSVNAKIFTDLIKIPANKKYDAILAMPPYLPYVRGKAIGIITAGNRGDKYLKSTLKLIERQLSSNGKAFILGIYCGKHTTIDSAFSGYFSKLGGVLIKTTRISMSQGLGSKILNTLLWNYIKRTKSTEVSKITMEITTDFEKNQIDEAILFVAHLYKLTSAPALNIIDFSTKYYGSWLQ